MSKFYFHICAEGTFIPDWSGTELPDLATAHSHALKIIHDSMFYGFKRTYLVRMDGENCRRAQAEFAHRALPQSYVDKSSTELENVESIKR